MIETKPKPQPSEIKKPLSNKEKEMLSKFLHNRYDSGILRWMAADKEYEEYLKEKNKK